MPDYEWSVKTALNISSGAEAVYGPITAGTQYIIVDADSEVYIRFDGVATANQIDSANDARWPAKTPDPIAIPAKAGVSGSVYLHVKQTVSTASQKARIVEL
ncbi:MAG: hypothetical protein HUU10_15160 [Bacteroidetes bacterium]|nr:hypothetical protein [Bacteroidota bacterium]